MTSFVCANRFLTPRTRRRRTWSSCSKSTFALRQLYVSLLASSRFSPLTAFSLQTLLAQSSSVRPSTQGILDGDAESGSLHELDTDSEEERRFEAEQAAKRGKGGRKSVRGRKSLSEAIAALEQEEDKGKTPRKQPSLAGKKGKGKAKEVEVEEDSEDELPPPKSAKKGRKSSRPEPPREEEEEEDELASVGAEEEEDEPVRHVSPKKRKAQVRSRSLSPPLISYH